MKENIKRGELYWVPLDENLAGKDIVHPHVVLQDTVINGSRITTTVVCALSTNMKRAYEAGNILLDPGEGGLPKQSIVIVSQVSVVEKTQIGEYIGRLSDNRMEQIFAGMKLLQGFIPPPKKR